MTCTKLRIYRNVFGRVFLGLSLLHLVLYVAVFFVSNKMKVKLKEVMISVVELQGMPGMHRHTLQFWQQSKYIYIYVDVGSDPNHTPVEPWTPGLLWIREHNKDVTLSW